MNNEDEARELREELEKWLGGSDGDRYATGLPERLTPEGTELAFDYREVFKREIWPLLERINELCKEHEIPMISAFVVEIPKHTTGPGTYVHYTMPHKICEIIAMLKVIGLPHEFSHMVIRNAQFYEYLMKEIEDDDEENGDN